MPSFTLWNVRDSTPKLREWYASMHNAYGADTRFLKACADAKEMYTAIPHNFLLRAIEYIIDRFETTNPRARRKTVCVERAARGSIRFGRSPNGSQFVNLTFEEVMTIVGTDIRTCYFVSLGVWLLQIVGVPMGSPGSPTYAICLCAYSEYQFYQSARDFAILHRLPDADILFRGARYVDDIIFLAVYDATSRENRLLAESVIAHLFGHTYHENMIIEPEPSEGWFPFLEIVLNLPAEGPLRIRFQNKNWDEFITTGRIGRLTICHRSSFMDERTAMLRVYATLYRVAAAADTDFYRIAGTLELFVLMRAQGYSARTFKAALHKYATRKCERLWKGIAKLIDHM